MIEITIRVSDEMARIIGELIKRIPDAEILRSVEDIKTESLFDECAKDAFNVLLNDGTIKQKRDFAWIMVAINQNVIDDFDEFDSYQSYIYYLKYLGISKKVPGKTTLFYADNFVTGNYPDWVFTEKISITETIRIKNVVKRFINAYIKAKREKNEREIENSI